MYSKANQPKTLQQAIRHFSDEQVCIDAVAALRWPDGPPALHVSIKDHYYLKTQRRWKCKECGRQFSVKLGTIFEDSPLSLDKWLCGLWMLVNDKNGISSYEVHRALGITQKSAWFMLHRLRYALQSKSLEKTSGEGGEVEADETFIGGKAKNMHKDKKVRLAKIRGAMSSIDMRERGIVPGKLPGKTAVVGLLDRESRTVRASVVGNVQARNLAEQYSSRSSPWRKALY